MKNIGLGVFCLVFALFIFLVTLSFPNADASYKDPAVYPTSILVLICLIGAILIIQGYISVKRGERGIPIDKKIMKLPVLLIGMTIAYVLIMQLVGFLISTFVYLLLVVMAFGGTRKQGMLFSFILTVTEYALFVWALRVRLPEPIFELIKSLS